MTLDSRSCWSAVCLVVVLAAAMGSRTVAQPAILDLAVERGAVRLHWDQPTNRFIVEQFSSFTSAPACCASSTGVVVDTVEFPMTSDDSAFFRLHVGLQAVRFEDVVLEAAIREAIETTLGTKRSPTNAIYDDELAAIEILDHSEAMQAGISNLAGLEFCTNLADATLRYNNITNVSLLAALTNLSKLDLAWNHISDASPLGNLSQLWRLNLSWNHITDIAFLSGLTNLWALYLDGNPISDFGPAANLPSLMELSLASCNISNLDFVAGLAGATGVYGGLGLILEHNDITDISPLRALTNAAGLRLGNNQIIDIDPLSELTQLNYIGLESNAIVDIGALVTNANLRGPSSGLRVRLSGNPLGSFAVTSQIPELQSRGVTVWY